MNIRAHHATNNAGGEANSVLREDLARQLFEQQVTGTVLWKELAAADRAEWRARAEQNLHALSSLGYRIEMSADPVAVQAEADRTEALAHIAAREAEDLLGMGEPLLAYNKLQKALVDEPSNLRLRQLKGLALARSGALRRANECLTTLRNEGHDDGETLGLLARTHKDLALLLVDDGERDSRLAEAFEIYAAGYRDSKQSGKVADAYYTGINAATMAFLRNDVDTARDIAADVEVLCVAALQACGKDEDAYWPQATLAEAALILGDLAAARERYAVAAKLAGTSYGSLSSTRRQAQLLLEHQGKSTTLLDDVMCVPPVLVYTGHMIDAPGRVTPRFGPHMEEAVRADIHARLQSLSPVAAYGSAACGADILCLECMRELGAELHIILPFPVERFREASVDFRPDGQWGDRFERLLDDANEVLVVSELPPVESTSTFEYANLIMTGLAKLRSEMLDTRLQGLAVWDGTVAGGPGGTSSVVSLWQDVDVPVEQVPLAPTSQMTSSVSSQGSTETDASGEGAWPFSYSIEAMLFADAVGYSRLTEEQVPLFFEHYMGTIAEFNDATTHKSAHIETAGDGMYMVFDDPGTAGHYALELSELVNSQDWASRGLPADLGIRVGLHCGPVFVGSDPITNLPLYTGIHTSRTARIEPITPPGQVYASSAFAAVATARDIEGLRFSYIGRTQLAKHYGVLPLYHVKRHRQMGVRQ